ncbi:hypothetical protein [Pedobacter endophyticus]|uniref:Uncharacterized protein n=1 Tax=Pedobacter endophyticus TaxID=2789740 RepID=A0A7U3Q394_9SPHI|nr:hypothetical protein [Pedobacter endophyticus]QPH37726.1 hypothetical protein IZT61_11430 [Pedobacter endophyticus]
MRTSRFFGILDVISIVLLAKQVWKIVTHFNEIPDQVLSQVKVILILALFVSLFASAAGLIANKKFGFITYYVQFPFRLLVWVFSIGFITYLPELFNLTDGWFSVLLRICFIAEFFRLYFTIQIHRKQF